MREDCPYAAFGQVYLQQQGWCLRLEQVSVCNLVSQTTSTQQGKDVYYCLSAKIITKQGTLAWEDNII